MTPTSKTPRPHKPGSGTPGSGKIPARERLLRAAADLFYREGIATVGVEKLCQTAGVSKRSMYQLFDTKDEVIAASLRQFGADHVAGYFPGEDADLTPRERILYVFERLEEKSATPDFRGCPFVNTAIEMKDPRHPASEVARVFKQRLTEYFAHQATLAGAADPQTLAAQLTVVFDGSTVRSVMQSAGLAGLSTGIAAALLDTAGVSP